MKLLFTGNTGAVKRRYTRFNTANVLGMSKVKHKWEPARERVKADQKGCWGVCVHVCTLTWTYTCGWEGRTGQT